MRGLAISGVVATHFIWIFIPNFVIGNFSAIDFLSSIEPFPLYTLLTPNGFALAILLAVSGYAQMVRAGSREALPPLPVIILTRYVRLVLPVLVVGFVSWITVVGFGGVHREASLLIYDYGGPTWLTQYLSQAPGIADVAAELLVGEYQSETALLPVLWMIRDLFLGSVLCQATAKFVPKLGLPGALLVLGSSLLAYYPLIATVILGGSIASFRPVGFPWIRSSAVRAWMIIGLTYAGLNTEGSGVGGWSLNHHYSIWVPEGWGPSVTAVSAVLLLEIALPWASWLGRARPGCIALGQRSFGIFLLHWPLLMTVACGTFVVAMPDLGYTPSVLASGAAFLLSLWISVQLFQQFLERPLLERL